jgi:hypothetical protein
VSLEELENEWRRRKRGRRKEVSILLVVILVVVLIGAFAAWKFWLNAD